MAIGAVGGALNGGSLDSVIQGAGIGAISGGFVGGIGSAVYASYGVSGTYAMLGAGAVVATAAGGLDGLAYYGGGLLGGAAGAVWASDLTMPKLQSGQPIEDDPLSFDGKELTATDAKGNKVDSWKASSGRPGTTPADQGLKDVGPIPEGKYSVNSGKIQKWSELSFLKKVAATFYLTKTWSGGVPAWGHYRVPIDIPGGSILGRDNFFIHEGWFSGSAGCIDVGSGGGSFFNYLSGQRNSIPLTVKY